MLARGDRREELLDAAEGVVQEEGVAGLTIDRVAARAGVAKGTVYLYFASKDQLVGALKSRGLEQMTGMVVTALARLETGDWWGTADAVVESVVDFDLARPWYIEVLAMESGDEESRTVYREATLQMLGPMIAALRQGVEDGVFDVEDPEMTGTLLYFALQGTLHHILLYEPEVDRDRLVAAATTFMHRALGDG